MLNFIGYVFASIGGVGTLLLAWTFVTKKTLDHFFQRDLETYKDSLKSESDGELEKKKKDLQTELETHKNNLKSSSDERLEEKKKDLQVALESYKNTIKNEGEHKLEMLRSDLQKANTEQMETLKSRLQREAQIESTRYGELQKKRFDTILCLYGKLTSLHKAVGALANLSDELEIKYSRNAHGHDLELNDNENKVINSVIDNVVEIEIYFLPLQIYFPHPFCEHVHRTIYLCRTMANRTGFTVDPNVLSTTFGANLKKSCDEAAREIPLLMNELAKDFRALIGVPG
jgi:F0F1-type ATP synthase membrane subunit b/b'